MTYQLVASSNGMPVMVLNRNEPAFYCVPANVYEAMMEMLDPVRDKPRPYFDCFGCAQYECAQHKSGRGGCQDIELLKLVKVRLRLDCARCWDGRGVLWLCGR